MRVGTGEAECRGCGYVYSPKKGDPDYPVSPGTKFEVRSLQGVLSVGSHQTPYAAAGRAIYAC